MSKTFLQLVNEVVEETKSQLDELTEANFASPPRTVMYNKFKRWINMAYKELFAARNEWFFRKERTTVVIWPRLQLAGLTTLPVAGDIVTAQSSGVIFTVQDVHTFEDIELDDVIEITVSVEFSEDSNPANLIMREELVANRDGVEFALGHLKGTGRYDFRAEIPRLQEIDPTTVRIYDTPTRSANSPSIAKVGFPLKPMAWKDWQPEYELYPWSGEYPVVISETALGSYDLHPKPSRDFVLSFEFTRKAPELVYYDDVPEALPEEYHDYLVWRAVEEYADFNQDPRLFSRAQKHTRNYWNWMDRDQKQQVGFAPSKF